MVAARLGRTVGELLASVGVVELRSWYAFLALEAEDQQRAIDQARG